MAEQWSNNVTEAMPVATASGSKTVNTVPKELLSLDPKLQTEFQKRVASVRKRGANKPEKLTPGVVYLGHLPRGLYEPQLKEYFTQFGTVKRLRLSRSKKTGNSKGYGFLEFESDDVAKIVADTMNNYLFCERLLKCHFVPPEKVHEELFKGCDIPFSKPSHPAVKRYNKERTYEEKIRMEKRFKKKENKLRKRLAEKGIDYTFPKLVLRNRRKKKVSGTTLQKSVDNEDLPKKEKMNISETAFDSVDSQGPTPICSPTFLERRKAQAAEMNDDDEDNEIVLKLPPIVNKKATPLTQTPPSSRRKKAKNNKGLS
ncbi:MKI67 FHA domain-interacting nucleolar phosphoprotein isoform X2 [Antechinus flavipes]|uniref:MKI67 FHA domain-interacting nucleolar phosphoprotein isoform X1 n=1 Tax=Antechinus flavipes TaxID=38775 RepID=UPI00223678F1|nr:MKI67 FHA domain-interacting nucleolar phosphoprotein isoform X1 [Antechinus flavipes]XP_051841681.1 MKI67 FHA domain-interacting nucleolar phosphoprotein isoform X2 [Antechinus flavipes]